MMDDVEIVLAAVVLAVLAGAALVVWRLRPARVERTPPPAPAPPRVSTPRTSLRLDVQGGDPDHPSVQRLARSVALPVLERSPDVEEVLVKDRDGRLIARITRPEPPPEPEEHGDLPFDLRLHPRTYEPAHRGVTRPPDVEPEPPTPFAHHYDLPAAVTERLRDPDDPVDVVRAILDAGGRRATARGERVLTDDELLIVLPGHRGVVTSGDLTHAYLTFHASRAPRGVAICLGYVDPDEIRRRELLAPALRHAGHDAIQRMADAVALGADPLAFVEAPPVRSEV